MVSAGFTADLVNGVLLANGIDLTSYRHGHISYQQVINMELDVHRRAICLNNRLTSLESSLDSFIPSDSLITIRGTEYSFVRESPCSQDFVLVKQGDKNSIGGYVYNPSTLKLPPYISTNDAINMKYNLGNLFILRDLYLFIF